MNKMTKEEYEAWASIPEQPELGDLIKEVARLKKALAEQKRLILEEGEAVKKVGDFAGEGAMKILGMTKEDLLHDIEIYNQAITDYQERIKQLFET